MVKPLHINVLHIGKYFPPHYGGIETFMSQLMAQQQHSGLEVSALVHQRAADFTGFEQQWQGCRVLFVKTYGQLAYAPIAPGYWLALIRALKQIKPDVIHVHMPNLSAFWLLLLKPLLAKNAKLIIHWHADVIGSVPDLKVKLLYPLYRLFEYQLLRQAQSVICTSPNYLATSSPLIPFRQKCVVIPLGISLSEGTLQLTQSLRNQRDSKYPLRLICIGRLTYYKGHKYLFEAVKNLVKIGYDIRLDVIGTGELENELRRYISLNDLTNHIVMHGRVGEKIKIHYLKRADLLCLPSIERTEAFGVVILEAASFGIPALVTDVEGSGMSYVVQDRKTGIVVKACCVSSIVYSIGWLERSRDSLDALGDGALSRVLKTFEINNVKNKITQLYQYITLAN